MLQDSCDFFSLNSITSDRFKEIFSEGVESGEDLIKICLDGDGNIAHLISLDLIESDLSDLKSGIDNLGTNFAKNEIGFLPILDINIGTRIDHCCIVQGESTSMECSGLFPYSTYMSSSSLLSTLNNDLKSCSQLINLQFVFYHPKNIPGYYDDCPSGSYVSTISLTNSNLQCVVLSDINPNGGIPSNFNSLCPASLQSSVSDIFLKLVSYANSVKSPDPLVCPKFYGLNNPYLGYNETSTNNLFALFKKNH